MSSYVQYFIIVVWSFLSILDMKDLFGLHVPLKGLMSNNKLKPATFVQYS